MSALDKQVSGNHYKGLKIQPIEYIHANGLDYLQGNVVKYVTRHKSKNGAADIQKAIHYLELILQLQYGEEESQVHEIVGTEPVNDGWIDWSGGVHPLGVPVEVEVFFRDGNTDTGMSNEFAWFHDRQDDDIIKYRVVK